jgi:hypothetical protein
MNIREKLFDLDLDFNIGLQAPEFELVAERLKSVTTAALSNAELHAIVESIVFQSRHDPLAQDVRASNHNQSSKCLICSGPMEQVSLSRTRAAYYCKAHKCVIPVPAE